MSEFLQAKTVLVTGGQWRSGTTIVRTFALRGATVFATFSKFDSLKVVPEDLQKNITFVETDVTDPDAVAKLFAEVLGKHAKVDVVVNTVGGFVPGNPIAETPVEHWDRMMNLNLRSTFLCTREALRRMKGQPYGRIINMAAMTGLVPLPNKAAYSISKAGVALFSELAGRENAGTGITVNAIAPSIIDTPANRASMPGENFSAWVTPEQIFETISFLCSEAGRAVTGTTIRAVGGLG